MTAHYRWDKVYTVKLSYVVRFCYQSSSGTKLKKKIRLVFRTLWAFRIVNNRPCASHFSTCYTCITSDPYQSLPCLLSQIMCDYRRQHGSCNQRLVGVSPFQLRQCQRPRIWDYVGIIVHPGRCQHKMLGKCSLWMSPRKKAVERRGWTWI